MTIVVCGALRPRSGSATCSSQCSSSETTREDSAKTGTPTPAVPAQSAAEAAQSKGLKRRVMLALLRRLRDNFQKLRELFLQRKRNPLVNSQIDSRASAAYRS